MSDMWKPIQGFPHYLISSSGRLLSLHKSRKELVQKVDRYGYKCVCLRIKGDKKNYYRTVHRLVVFAFLGEPPTDKHQVCHSDGNPANNHISNLRWGTVSENANDAIQHGTWSGLKNRGSNNGQSKLTEDQVRSILVESRMSSMYSLAKKYKVSSGHIARIITGKKWAHISQMEVI